MAHKTSQETEGRSDPGLVLPVEVFRLLAEECPVSIMAFDTRGIVTFVNRWHLKTFARNRQPAGFFLGRRIFELPGLVRAGVAELLLPILEGERVELPEVFMPRFTGGHSGWVTLRGVPLVQEGAIRGGVLIREDITAYKEMEARLRAAGDERERQVVARTAELGRTLDQLHVQSERQDRVEQSLLESERKFRSLFESAGDAIAIHRVDGPFLEINQAACKLLGYSRGELLSMGPLDIEPPEHHAQVKANLQRLRQRGQIQTESVHLAKGGRRIPVELSARIFNYQGDEAVLVIVRDISARKEAEKALAASQHSFRHAFEHAAMGKAIVSPDGVFREVNPALGRMLGYRPEELVGKHFLDVTHPEDYPLSMSLNRSLKAEAQEHKEVVKRYLHKSGRPVWARLNSIAVRDDDGELLYIIGQMQDITEQKHAMAELAWESALNAAMAQVSQALLDPAEPGRICELLLKEAMSLTGSAMGYVGHIDPQDGCLVCPAVRGAAWDHWRTAEGGLRFSGFSGPWGWVLTQRQPLLSNQPAGDPRCADAGEGHPPLDNFLSVPAMLGDELLGQISVANAEGGFEPRDLRLIQRLASLLALAVQRDRQQARVREYQDQLRALASQLGSAEERERLRIAMDLHDGVGQSLAMCKLKLQMLSGKEDGRWPELAQAVELLERAINDARNLTTDLSPPVLFELGLAPAMSWLVERAARDWGLKVSLRDRSGQVQPDRGTRLFLFRTASELLNNVFKHSGTDQAELTITMEEGHLRLEVADFGAGFIYNSDDHRSQTGFGLFSLRERLRLLGGSLTIDSAPGKGTTVTAQLPLSARPGQPRKGL